MGKRPTLKIEPDIMPMPGRSSWSLNVFVHSVGAAIDVARSFAPLCAGFAGDHGAGGFYRADDRTWRGYLSVYGTTVSECHVMFSDDAASWIEAAMAFCQSGVDRPESQDCGANVKEEGDGGR